MDFIEPPHFLLADMRPVILKSTALHYGRTARRDLVFPRTTRIRQREAITVPRFRRRCRAFASLFNGTRIQQLSSAWTADVRYPKQHSVPITRKSDMRMSTMPHLGDERLISTRSFKRS